MATIGTERGQWSSRTGFILAAAGSAIGLGNIWRFPFVLLYVVFVAIIGLPYMFAELSLGRATQKNPAGAIDAIKQGSGWRAFGMLGVLTGVGILSFYGVIAGWTFGYIFKMAVGKTAGFTDFIANPWLVLGLFACFMLLTTSIVYGGIQGGIERWSKILMPLLFMLLLALIIYANTLEGAAKGLAFYLQPDFSKITGSVALAALGQAFFSLSLGMGLMVTYGSYVPKKENLIVCGISIGIFDTLIAIFAGLIIFPALFAMGQQPDAGPTLVFVVLPELFAKMPGALFTFLVGVPSALSQGATDFWTNFGVLPARLTGDPDFLSHVSFVFGDFSLAFGALLMSIFVRWVWGASKAADGIAHGSDFFGKDSRHLDVYGQVFYTGRNFRDFVESVWFVRLTPVAKR
jgi:NSS family neurotransmitter:Na+ symporter